MGNVVVSVKVQKSIIPEVQNSLGLKIQGRLCSLEPNQRENSGKVFCQLTCFSVYLLSDYSAKICTALSAIYTPLSLSHTVFTMSE